MPYREPAQPSPDSDEIQRDDDERASIPPAVGKAIPRDDWFEAGALPERESVALLLSLGLVWGVTMLFL